MLEDVAAPKEQATSGSAYRSRSLSHALRRRRLRWIVVGGSMLLLAVVLSVAEGPPVVHRTHDGPVAHRKPASQRTSPAVGPAPQSKAVSRRHDGQRVQHRVFRIGWIPRDLPVAEPVIVHTTGRSGNAIELGSGGVAAGGCTFHIECDDGNPCTIDRCDRPPEVPPGDGTCIHDAVADGDAGDCDNGLFCDGREVCNAGGSCESRDVPDCAGTGQVCDEFQDACVDPCTTDAGCDDGLLCNGTETCGPDGVCQPGTNPCGPGATCEEGVCSVSLDPCTRDTDCGDAGGTCSLPGPGCFEGRCCFTLVSQPPSCTNHAQCPSGRCQYGTCDECVNDWRRTSAQGPSQNSSDQCEERGGLWYATDTGKPDLAVGTSCAFRGHHCPQYSSGIAPSGDFLVTVGPVSGSPVAVDMPNGPGAALFSLGDDYHFAEPDLLDLEGFRWVGGADRFGKAQFELYDWQGRLVDDFLADVGPQIAVRPILLDPPIIIPRDGFVVVRVPKYPEPNLRLFWLSTDEADVGANDPDILAWNDCQRGCNPSGCANFLAPDPGILTFEMVGAAVWSEDYPIGPCCNRATHACELKNEWECTSGYCVGGTNDCQPCSDDASCPEGYCDDGVFLGIGQSCNYCSIDSPVTPFGPCSTSDDCGGGTCLAPCDNAACCLPDGTCINDTTIDACTTMGGESLGYGTDCDPDCCARPVSAYTGADDCLDVIVQALTIPAEGVCGSGDNRGQSCLSSADCASPGVCIRSASVTTTGNNSMASSTPENPDSCIGQLGDMFDDPGWWEAFHIDECASVLVDLCCTEPIHEPAYRILFRDCPCGPPIFANPNPFGDCATCLSVPSSLGRPYCDEDNLWSWYGPLAAGTYYYPIYSSPHGHLGQYQLHIRADACPVAACCNGSECSLANVLDCEAGGGFFLGPPGKWPLEPSCAPNSPDCSPSDGTNCGTCQLGSCCSPPALGPGTCVDLDGTDRITEEACIAAGGTFKGGIRCHGGTCSNDSNRSCTSDSDCFGGQCVGDADLVSQDSPCPLCEILGANNCHGRPTIATECDISEYTSGELTVADDFVPTADTLTTLCTSGLYVSTLPDDVDDTTGCRLRAVLPMPAPLDKFRIRVYEDGADDSDPNTPPDLPGTLLAERFASSTGSAWQPDPPRVEGSVARRTYLFGPNTDLFGLIDLTDEDYQIDISNDPITGLQLDGRRYWIEILNNMDQSPPYQGEPSCIWFINHSDEGNLYTAIGAHGKFLGAKPVDLSFCLNFPFSDSFAPTGACCDCTGSACTNDVTLERCAASDGKWTARGECNGPDAVSCTAQPPANDTSEGAIDITTFGDPTVEMLVIPTQHFCATTSLPDVHVCTDFSPPADCNAPCGGLGSAGDYVGQDLWYKYVAPANGRLEIGMCPTGTAWDSLFAIYKGPDGADDGTGNSCPVITDIASCNAAAFPDDEGAVGADEGCTKAPVGGAGYTVRAVSAGTCYLIQAGAWGPTSTTPGLSFVTLRYAPPPLSLAPCDNDFAEAISGAGGERLSRFGCVTPVEPVPSGATAIRVRFRTLYNTTPGDPDGASVCPIRTLRPYPPPSLSQFEGQTRWLAPPGEYQDDAQPEPPKYIAARLVCTAAEAEVRDWSPAGLQATFGDDALIARIFFYDSAVVPCSVYEVSQCADPFNEVTCSDPVLIFTGRMGDVWPSFGFAQPSYLDINALVNKYRGIPFSPGATPQGGAPEWHALQVGNELHLAGRLSSFLDINATLNSYKGLPYKEQGPCDVGTATDNCGKPCSTAPGD